MSSAVNQNGMKFSVRSNCDQGSPLFTSLPHATGTGFGETLAQRDGDAPGQAQFSVGFVASPAVVAAKTSSTLILVDSTFR